MDTNNSNSNNNGNGRARVNGETKSRNFANNKRNFNKNNDINRDKNKDNGEVNRDNRENKTPNKNNNGYKNKNYYKNKNVNRNTDRNTDRNISEKNKIGGFVKELVDSKPTKLKIPNKRADDNNPNNKNYVKDKNLEVNNKRKFNKNLNNVNNKKVNNKKANNDSFTDVDLDDELENLQLEGRNAVLEAIRIKRPIDKILLKKGEVEGTLKVIKAKALQNGIIVQETAKSNLDEMAKSHNHQGVIAMCAAQEYAEVEDMLELAKEKGEEPFIVILDGITDTYNLGAIIRSANAAGAHGVIIPKRRAAGLSAMVSKASAGAILYTKVARVTNITTEIQKLKEAGLWIVGTDMKAKSLHETSLKGPVAIVIGSEGDGISRLVKEKCDLKVSIPMLGEIESLNASVASGVLMYEIVRQRLNG